MVERTAPNAGSQEQGAGQRSGQWEAVVACIDEVKFPAVRRPGFRLGARCPCMPSPSVLLSWLPPFYRLIFG
jgi:hypothetical protein